MSATPAAPTTAPADRVRIRLLPLREDLALLPAPPERGGAPAWTIHDPVRNRYFRIGAPVFDVVARWHLGSPEAIAGAVTAQTLAAITPEDVLGIYQGLVANNLIQTTDTASLARQAAAGRTGWFWWLLHNYLFFRVPLVRPDRFLDATAGWVAPFYTRAWAVAVAAAGSVGLLLALRQWDAFVHTFRSFLTAEGVALYGLALLGTKLFHELGHAWTAKRFGCRVPTMGVAFLVLWPVLYTDTTDAWRLVSRRQRLAVAAAGMLAELTIAVFATLAWSFLPDGPLRSAAYFLATVSWVTTLAINLSPFMRFDGYYLLSDALDVPNLQDRAFAVARWKLREWLFGLGEPEPEPLPSRLRWIMLAYAYGTWIYRLILFTGIALLVYHMAFKLLGIVLFAVEIGWFVIRPLLTEARAWWRRRGRFRRNPRTLATLAGLAGVAGLTFLPVAGTVAVPAVWRAADAVTLHAPFAARLEAAPIQPGQRVAAGDVLFRLTDPDLDSKLTRVDLRIALMQDQLGRMASSREGLDRLRALEEDLAAALAERQGLSDNRARLEIRSPLAGVVVDREDALVPGRWIGPKLALATVVAAGPGELVGYVTEADLDRLRPGMAARFHADDPLRPRLDARVRAVDPVNAGTLDIPALASVHGGPVAVEGEPGGTGSSGPGGLVPRGLVPVEAVYRVTLDPVGKPATGGPEAERPERVIRGVARVEADAHSLAGRFWRIAASVVIREAGF